MEEKNTELLDFDAFAQVYLNASRTLEEIVNRTVSSYYASFYLLSHSLELAIKGRIADKGLAVKKEHKLSKLVALPEYYGVFDFSQDEQQILEEFDALNTGPGGMRYPQGSTIEDLHRFLPTTFSKGAALAKKLIPSDGYDYESLFIQ